MDAPVPYRLYDSSIMPAGSDHILVENGDGEPSRLLPADFGFVVRACVVPRPLAEHARIVCHAGASWPRNVRARGLLAFLYRWFRRRWLGGGETEPASAPALHALARATNMLGELVSAGVLRSDDELRAEILAAVQAACVVGGEQECCGPDADTAPQELESLCIAGRWSPQQLERSATSWASRIAEVGGAKCLVVMDHTPAGGTARAHQDQLGLLARRYGVRIRYFGADWRRELLRRLTQVGAASPAVLEFGFGGGEGFRQPDGAAGNLFLLESYGSRALLLCGAATPAPARREAGNGAGLVLSAALDPPLHESVWREPCSKVETTNADSVQEHQRLLGAPAAAAVRSVLATGGELLLGSMAPTFIRDLRSNKRIRITFGGEMAAGVNAGRVVLRCGILVKLPALPAPAMDASAQCLPVLGNRQRCAGEQLGVDHDELLPPMLPGDTSCGVLWATVVNATCGSQFRLRLPSAQAGRRSHTPATRWSLHYEPAELLALLSHSFGNWYPRLPRGSNMAALGRYLTDLAAQNSDDFGSYAQVEYGRSQALALTQLAEEASNSSAKVRKILEDGLARLERAAVKETRVPQRRNTREAAAELQRMTRGYGELLTHWSGIVSGYGACRESLGQWCEILRR